MDMGGDSGESKELLTAPRGRVTHLNYYSFNHLR